MQDQIREVIVERVTESEKSVDIHESKNVFYLPHRPVIREPAKSAKASKRTVSLNECLETGPLLQNSHYEILVRSCMRPIIFCGDIQKTLRQD